MRGTRERKHPHYLKGMLYCRVCGGRLSVQHSKSRYTYFFCLGQKHDPSGTCRERYVSADDLEAQVEALYQRIQLPEAWTARLREELDAEVIERQRADAAQRELITHRLARRVRAAQAPRRVLRGRDRRRDAPGRTGAHRYGPHRGERPSRWPRREPPRVAGDS
jgi:hypothetical protein